MSARSFGTFVASCHGYLLCIELLALRWSEYSLIVTRNVWISTPRITAIPSSRRSLDTAGVAVGHVSSIGQLLRADDGDRNLLLVDPNTGTSTIIASNVGGGRGLHRIWPSTP